MSLLRLLTSGKSLIGLRDEATRYRMCRQGSLPQFGSANNPFRENCAIVKAVGSNPVTSSEVASDQKVEMFNPLNAGAESSVQSEVEQVSVNPPPGNADPGLHRVQATVDRRPQLVSPDGSRQFLWSNGLGAKLQALVGKLFRLKAKRAVPPFGRAAQQGELSLDSVKVVRNDLTDCDLAIVRAGVQPAPVKAASKVGGSVGSGGEAINQVSAEPGQCTLVQAAGLSQPAGDNGKRRLQAGVSPDHESLGSL